MAKNKIKKIILVFALIIFIPFALLVGSLLMDLIPLSAAKPPKDLKTIDNFYTWKRGEIKGRGTFESGGRTYTVMLAPAGRYLASGPSAYLFDENGNFIDWTADMGDFQTVNKRFDLTHGNVKNIESIKNTN